MKYDKNKGQYYITEDDLVNEKGITQKELRDALGNTKVVLLDFSNTIYRYIYNYYRGGNKERHIREVKMVIDTNPIVRHHLKEAMLEYAMGAIISEMDLNKYLDEGKKHIPDSAIDELKNSGILKRRNGDFS